MCVNEKGNMFIVCLLPSFAVIDCVACNTKFLYAFRMQKKNKKEYNNNIKYKKVSKKN